MWTVCDLRWTTSDGKFQLACSGDLTRGSQEPVIAHLVFNLTSKVDRNGGVLHIILKVGNPKIISTQISEQNILL